MSFRLRLNCARCSQGEAKEKRWEFKNVALESENRRSRGSESPLNLDLSAVFVSFVTVFNVFSWLNGLFSKASMYSMCV